MSEVRLCCFAGTGATGKTSVMNALSKVHVKGREPDLIIKPSIVREYYKRRGIVDEITFFSNLSDEEKRGFQIGLLDFFINDTTHFIQRIKNDGKESSVIVLMDRSVYDHIAYLLVYCMSNMDEEVVALIYKTYVQKFEALSPNIVYFPFPVSWDYSNGNDEFRYRSFGKDYVHDSVLKRILRERYTLPGGPMPIEKICLIKSKATVEERLAEVKPFVFGAFEWAHPSVNSSEC